MVNSMIDRVFIWKYYVIILVVYYYISTLLRMFTHYIPPARKWSEKQSA